MAAEKDHSDAQVGLAMMYRLGQGTPRQDGEALKWALKAAEQGNLDGQKAAAVFYSEGDGIPQNWSEAYKWTLKAAMQNDPTAEYNLAFFYSKGLSVTQDVAEAYKWFSVAARDGYLYATNGLVELRDRMSEAEIAEGERRASTTIEQKRQ